MPENAQPCLGLKIKLFHSTPMRTQTVAEVVVVTGAVSTASARAKAKLAAAAGSWCTDAVCLC